MAGEGTALPSNDRPGFETIAANLALVVGGYNSTAPQIHVSTCFLWDEKGEYVRFFRPVCVV